MDVSSKLRPKRVRVARSQRAARETGSTWITVLHVEDDANDRELLQAAVSEAGVPFRIHSVNDAESAKAYLSGCGVYSDGSCVPTPALILLDLKMRRLNGTEVLKWVRAQPELASVPVVVLSGSGSEEDMRQVYADGANGFIIKPLGFFALVEMVRHLNFNWFVAPQSGRMAINQQFFKV